MSRGRTPCRINERRVIAALQMIAAHIERPCPTRREVMEWTGVPRRQVWGFLGVLAERGLIEVEVAESREAGKDPKRRRLRVVGGPWTGWTARMRPEVVRPRLLALMTAGA